MVCLFETGIALALAFSIIHILDDFRGATLGREIDRLRARGHLCETGPQTDEFRSELKAVEFNFRRYKENSSEYAARYVGACLMSIIVNIGLLVWSALDADLQFGIEEFVLLAAVGICPTGLIALLQFRQTAGDAEATRKAIKLAWNALPMDQSAR